ncbi:MAG: TMEM43 family protein [Lysobacteraceae bacterium]
MKTILLALMLAVPMVASAQQIAPTTSHAIVASGTVHATDAAQQPHGQIESSVEVSDPDFGVHAKVLGLERRIEMLQWHEVDRPTPPHYEQAWSAERVDSSMFDVTHKNPGDLPFNGARWWSADPKLDGHPVSADVLAALDAWVPLKPDLVQLPTNLAVSFQPDGDWLSTSQDPAHPRIGDVRVRWHQIEHASAPAGTVLVSGHWELPALAQTPAASTQQVSPPPTEGWMQRVFGDHMVLLLVIGIALALLLLIWKHRR